MTLSDNEIEEIPEYFAALRTLRVFFLNGELHAISNHVDVCT